MPQQLFDDSGKPVAAGPRLFDEKGKPADGAAISAREPTWLESASDFGENLLSAVNPLPALEFLYHHGWGATLKNVNNAQAAQATKAKAAFDRGDYTQATASTLNWLLPLIGPGIDHAQTQLNKGEYAAGLGTSVGLGLGVAAGPALENAALKLPALVRPTLNPVEADAVAFADRSGVPLDTATRTGNQFVRGAQNILQKQPGSAGVAQAARQAQTDALTKVGGQLKTKVEPNLPGEYSPETAGQAVVDSIESRRGRFDVKADEAYGELRKAEADPANTRNVQTGTQTRQQTVFTPQGGSVVRNVTAPVMEDVPLPVDMRPVKASLRPIYDRILQRMPVAQQRADPALHALSNIFSGKDHVPASVADANLSAIKAMARGATSADVRTVSQGTAAAAVKEFQQAVDTAVAQAGPDATAALERGRALTRAKYEADDVLKSFVKGGEEPVQVFRALTANKDTRVNLLRDVVRQSPQDLPKIAKAYLQGLFETATSEGGFGRSATLYNKWEALGPETKNVLFKDPKLIADLDNFFLIAKRIADNPNPSGTASTAATMVTAGLVVTNPVAGVSYLVGENALARMLFTSRGSRAMVNGLKVPLGNKAAASFAASEILRLAGPDAKPVESGLARSSAQPAPAPRAGPPVQ